MVHLISFAHLVDAATLHATRQSLLSDAKQDESAALAATHMRSTPVSQVVNFSKRDPLQSIGENESAETAMQFLAMGQHRLLVNGSGLHMVSQSVTC